LPVAIGMIPRGEVGLIFARPIRCAERGALERRLNWTARRFPAARRSTIEPTNGFTIFAPFTNNNSNNSLKSAVTSQSSRFSRLGFFPVGVPPQARGFSLRAGVKANRNCR
jgi:hypothetical protein